LAENYTPRPDLLDKPLPDLDITLMGAPQLIMESNRLE
jgi:hypothetical protein